VFPASTRAAVHGMRMKVGRRVVEAHIDRRQVARDSYEAARAQGRRASLLEQERPNVFTMNVANIMPGDRIEVQLDYSELLVPEDAVYEFVFPTVVGPRYAGGADPQKDKWMASPHLPAGAPSPVRFDLGVHLETGVGLKELSSPSHAIDVTYASANVADVELRDAQQGTAGNRDFVLRYRLAGDKIESGLLLSPRGADGDGYFASRSRPSSSRASPRT
jgi:Ca-activated chloride channel family protein